MRPLLEDRFDPLVRGLLYLPVALVAGVLLFLILGFTNLLGFAASLVFGLAAGFGLALAVTGSPAQAIPEEYRGWIPWLYFPLALVVLVLGYFLLGLAYASLGLPVGWSAIVSLAGAVVLALVLPYLLVGFPDVGTSAGLLVGRVPEGWWEHTPWLFFPLALVLGLLSYMLVGLAYTASPLPSLYLTQVSLLLATVAGLGLAYLAVGFPDTPEALRHPLGTVPEDRRPWLLFPLGLVLATVLFLALGVAYTSTPFLPTDLGLPVALLLAVILGFGGAYLLVGAPTPEEPVRDRVPEMPPAGRPVAFAVTFLAAGPILAFLLGSALALVPGVPLLPQPWFLPLALLLGYLAAFAIAAAIWGVPGDWKGVPAPGLPEDARLALVLPLAIVLAALFTFLVELFTPLGLVVSALVGVSAGVLAALYGTGATDRLEASDRETLLPELPETVKPLVFLPAWVGLGTLLTFLLGYVGVPFTWALVAGVSLGFAGALVVVEEPLLRQALDRRRQRKAREEELEQRRRELLEGET